MLDFNKLEDTSNVVLPDPPTEKDTRKTTLDFNKLGSVTDDPNFYNQIFQDTYAVGSTGIGESPQYDTNIPLASIDRLNSIRAERQGLFPGLFNAVVGGVSSGLLTAVEDASYILDVPSWFDETEKYERNFVADWARDNKESIAEILPLYRRNPDKVMDFSDSAFYLEMLKGILDSAIGFGAVGLGSGALVKGALTATRTGAYLNLVRGGMGDAAGLVGSSIITNYGESKMMALENYDEIKQSHFNILREDLIKNKSESLGIDINDVELTEQELDNIEVNAANEAARQHDNFMLQNRVFMFTDMVGLAPIFRGTKATRNLIDEPTLRNFARSQLKQAPVEGFEEIGQNVLQLEGQYQAQQELIKQGIEIDPEDLISEEQVLIDRVIEFATSEEALLEGMMGLVSGLVQYGITTAPFRNTRAEQDRYNKQQSLVKNYESLTAAKIVQLQEAHDLKNRVEQSGQLSDNILGDLIVGTEFENIVVEAFNHGTTEVLASKISEVANNEQESAENRQKATALLQELDNLERQYQSFQRFTDPSRVFNNRLTYNRLSKLGEGVDNLINESRQNAQNRLNEINSRYPNVEDLTLEEFESPKGLKGKKAIYNIYNKDESVVLLRSLQKNKDKVNDKLREFDEAYQDMKSANYNLRLLEFNEILYNQNIIDTNDKIKQLNAVINKGISSDYLRNSLKGIVSKLKNAVEFEKNQATVEARGGQIGIKNEATAETREKVKRKVTPEPPDDTSASSSGTINDAFGVKETSPDPKPKPKPKLTIKEINSELYKNEQEYKKVQEEISQINEILDSTAGLDENIKAAETEKLKDAKDRRSELATRQAELHSLRNEMLDPATSIENQPVPDVDETVPPVIQNIDSPVPPEGIKKAVFKKSNTENSVDNSVKNKLEKSVTDVEIDNIEIADANEVTNDFISNENTKLNNLNERLQGGETELKQVKLNSQQGLNLESLDWILNGYDKKGTVGTIVESEPYYDTGKFRLNQLKAVRMLREKGSLDNMNEQDRDFVIDFYPLSFKVNETVSIPIFTVQETDVNRTDTTLQSYSERLLRKNAINAISRGNTYQTVVTGQYPGEIQTSDTDISLGEYTQEDVTFMFSDEDGKIRNLEGDREEDFLGTTIVDTKTDSPWKGILFMKATMANGLVVPIKLNTAKLDIPLATSITDIYLEVINPANNIKGELNILEKQLKSVMPEIYESLVKTNPSDMSYLGDNVLVRDVLSHFVFQGDKTKELVTTQLYVNKGNLFYGTGSRINYETLLNNKQPFINWLAFVKPRQVSIKDLKGKVGKDGVSYRDLMTNNGVIRTTLIPGQPAFARNESLNPEGDSTVRMTQASMYISPFGTSEQSDIKVSSVEQSSGEQLQDPKKLSNIVNKIEDIVDDKITVNKVSSLEERILNLKNKGKISKTITIKKLC